MFNIQAAISRMYGSGLAYIGTVGPKSKGRCAAAVRQFIEAGGISTAGRPVSAYQYKAYLPSIGFNCVATIFGRAEQAAWSNTYGKPGDIAVMDHGEHGHICMWNGREWVSDFFQGNRMWVYSGDGACYVFRYNGVTIPGLVPFNIQAPITQSRIPQTAPEGVKLKRLWSMYAKKGTYTTNTSNSFSPTGELITAMSTPTNINASIPGEIVNFICKKETGKSYGYQMAPKDLNGYNLGDAGGHRTFGYGLLFHPTLNKYMDQVKQSWTQSELESLYIQHINMAAGQVRSWAGKAGVNLSPNQVGAIVSAVFNCGPGFLKSATAHAILAKDPRAVDLWRHHSDKMGARFPGLLTRRQEEAAIFARG